MRISSLNGFLNSKRIKIQGLGGTPYPHASQIGRLKLSFETNRTSLEGSTPTCPLRAPGSPIDIHHYKPGHLMVLS
ncbi:hypothetical protein JTE90_004972 [Oedothorax gibbosus]|uniref:Uncharacterized protein n=1 Tax=Oedothorax gibbosus TaxID=931172 RepID=A0AAV6VHM6_9ARAC|nr:hypothetical protein JTE90_004972 [Oedothorax gibbosus]